MSILISVVVYVEPRPALPVQSMTDQTTMCLTSPFGVSGKKRKSAASEDIFHMDTDRIVIHNLDTSDEMSDSNSELSKRRRPTDNSANNGLFFVLLLLAVICVMFFTDLPLFSGTSRQEWLSTNLTLCEMVQLFIWRKFNDFVNNFSFITSAKGRRPGPEIAWPYGQYWP